MTTVFRHTPPVVNLDPAPNQAPTPEESALLAQARAGDPDAFCELCRFHEARLFRHAMTLCHNETLAEDLAQDTLVEAWKSLHRYNGRCQFFTWLCAILINRHRNSLRNACLPASRDHGDVQSALSQLPDQLPPPDLAAENRDRADLVQRCIAALPARHQQVIFLRFYVDDSLEAIAAALGCAVGTVKSRLFHALEKLRAMRALSSDEPGTINPHPTPKLNANHVLSFFLL